LPYRVSATTFVERLLANSEKLTPKKPKARIDLRLFQNSAEILPLLADLIITVVKERKVQVILESHSEHVLQRLLRRIAEGKTSKYPAISPDDVKLFFCRSVKGESALHQLKVNLFGSIENWPRDFFGDQFGEITAREEAALKRQRAAE